MASTAIPMSIDLSLDRIRVLASYLPTYTRPTCHIAGTNGKGSVTALLSSILMASSPPLSVGRFNSPHMISVHDSIVINNRPVTPSVYSAVRQEVEDADGQCRSDPGNGASSFELLTMTALLIFERARVDVAVIEVGMGGRSDATNIIPDRCILVSALTAVDLDHQSFLGNTIAEIASVKAGIARRTKPFVMGPQRHAEVANAVRKVVDITEGRRTGQTGDMYPSSRPATKQECSKPSGGQIPKPALSFRHFNHKEHFAQCVKVDFGFLGLIRAKLPLYGEHQLDNLGLVSGIVCELLTHPSCKELLPDDIQTRITAETIAHGIESVKWPGRLSFHTVPVTETTINPLIKSDQTLIVLADGAHNPSSSTTLSNFVQSILPLHPDQEEKAMSLTYILALSHSPPKTPLQTITPLLSPSLLGQRVKVNVALVRFTPPDGMPWVQSVSPADLRQTVIELAPYVTTWIPENEDDHIETQLRHALAWAHTQQKPNETEDGGLVVVAGSLYLVADLYRHMQKNLDQ